jgi:type II secretory pathway pseudopilin PulG
MTAADRIPEIPPAPFAKRGDDHLLKPLFTFFPSVSLFPFPSFKKGGQRGFSGGFTLVEVIVTILAAAIMGVIFIQLMGTAMSRSTEAVENVRDEITAEALMEQIVADYVFEINKADPTSALQTIVDRNYGPNVAKVFINFNAGVEVALVPPNKSRTLKITVEAPGNNLVTLLTESRQAGPPASPPVAY